MLTNVYMNPSDLEDRYPAFHRRGGRRRSSLLCYGRLIRHPTDRSLKG